MFFSLKSHRGNGSHRREEADSRARSKSRRTGGFTLLEFLFGVGVGALVISAVVGFSIFGSKSLASLYASCSLDQQNRATLDQMTKDLRGVTTLTSMSSNKFVCQDWDATSLTYVYDSTNQTLSRIKGTTTNVLLVNCTQLTFSYGMRMLSNGTFNVYPATNVLEAKTVTLDWLCARKVLGKSYDDLAQYATVNVRTKQ